LQEAEVGLKKDLEHFPFEDFSEEELSEVIEKYSLWVLKSVADKYPYFTDLETEIEYSQSRSSGPGGQNVNKTSTAVTARHPLTGMYARSEDSRDVPVNKKESLSKLLNKLEGHIKNWSVCLKNVPPEEKQEKIVTFLKNMRDEKIN
jgi:protein subunit release factor B